jgi:type IV pilus assembly protein PilW
MRALTPQFPGRQARGFTLLEILIALSIGLFLTGALLTIVQTNRRVFGEQTLLSQMQDNERMAMTMMGDVIQSAGYFPTGSPVTTTLSTSLIGAGPFAVGQSIYGTYSATPPGDQIQVRYMTTGGDGILNCSGGSNTGAPGPASNTLYVNTFWVLNGQLVCSVAGNTYTLVGGATGTGLDIQNMSILYGVNTTASGNNVDTYMNASQVTALGLWDDVISVQITMTFTNPLAGTSPSQPATFQFQRVIGVMSQIGPAI